MLNFEFLVPTRIVFGKDTELQTGSEIKKLYDGKVLLHYGSESAKKSGLLGRIEKSLKDAGVEYEALGGVQPNPRVSLVRKGIELCKKENIGFILAVGGGSVIDSSKAIALGVPYDGDVWDIYDHCASAPEPTECLPLGVVLTIPAAGSESSPSSVITNEETGRKYGKTTELTRPRFAIMNPELTCSLPPYQTACGAADIMAHIMERYFTNERGVDFTDRLCEATLMSIIRSVPLALENPNDYDARANIMWTGSVAHNDLLGTGRLGDWASHDIEHELSAAYDIAHGAGLAIIFPAWLKYNLRHDTARMAQYASRVWGVPYDFERPEETAKKGIAALESFFTSIGLPTRLSQAGIDDSRFEEMADKCTHHDTITKGQYVKLTKKDIVEIYKLAK